MRDAHPMQACEPVLHKQLRKPAPVHFDHRVVGQEPGLDDDIHATPAEDRGDLVGNILHAGGCAGDEDAGLAGHGREVVGLRGEEVMEPSARPGGKPGAPISDSAVRASVAGEDVVVLRVGSHGVRTAPPRGAKGKDEVGSGVARLSRRLVAG